MGPNNGVRVGKPGTKPEGKRKCSPRRVKNCLRTFLAHLFSHIGLCILVVGYAIAGAAIFEQLESGYENEQMKIRHKYWNETFQMVRQQYVTELWNITEKFNVLYKELWTSAVEVELRRFEEKVASDAEQHGYERSTSRDTDLHWSFSGALLYSVSIITTIGYGNTAPRTALGKVLTMFYAVIGVPLMLLWLSNIGTLMANTFKFAYNHICCPRKSSRSPARSVQKLSPCHEPSSIQVQYSVSQKTCETHVVPDQDSNPPNFHTPTKSRGTTTNSYTLKELDPVAKHMLKECAEYNLSTGDDERSRRVLQQLADDGVIPEEDPNSIILPPPPMETDPEENLYGGGVPSTRRQTLPVEGTPSRVPLLHRGYDGGPDVVDVEEYAESTPLPVPALKDNLLAGDRVPISLVLIFVVFYIIVGAMVFSVWEGWDFLESAYFCFITLSTIGLGDYVPGRSLKSAEGHAQLIVCCLYLVLGLAIIAMSFNLVQEEVAAKVKVIARHLGIIKDSSGTR